MDEGEPLRRSGGGNDSFLWQSAVGTTLTLPLSRYTARLMTSDHSRILLGDCGYPRSDENDYDIDDYSPRSVVGDGCFYSKPILVLDVVWNLAFVLVSFVVLLTTLKERPSTPLRFWLFGYAFQCLLHVGRLFIKYQKSNSRYEDEDPVSEYGRSTSPRPVSFVKMLDSMRKVVPYAWWMLGFYWIVMGGQTLLQGSPRLYWLTVVFLAFDVFFIIFCIGMAFVVFFTFCCCLPIVAFAYAMTIKEGASEEDIRNLPRYRFRQATSLWTLDDNKRQEFNGSKLEFGNSDRINELVLSPEDSVCCICLSRYVDGTELCNLPCNHHFHCGCISKWLRINATCPLCKFNILRGDTLV